MLPSVNDDLSTLRRLLKKAYAFPSGRRGGAFRQKRVGVVTTFTGRENKVPPRIFFHKNLVTATDLPLIFNLWSCILHPAPCSLRNLITLSPSSTAQIPQIYTDLSSALHPALDISHPAPWTLHLSPHTTQSLNYRSPISDPKPSPLPQYFSYFHNHNTQKYNSIKPQSRIFAYERVPARQCSNTLPACTLFQNTNFR